MLEENLSQQVPAWWWPTAILGGAVPIILVAGVIYAHEAPTLRVGLEPLARRTVRYRTANMFKRLLDEKGYTTKIFVVDEVVAVDFYHPRIRDEVLKLPYRRDLLESVVEYSTAGSAAFTDHGLEDANIPVVVTRDPAATGRLIRRVELYAGMRLRETHWHVHDGLTVFDLHVSFPLPERPSEFEMEMLAAALAEVVDEATRTSLDFLTKLRVSD